MQDDRETGTKNDGSDVSRSHKNILFDVLKSARGHHHHEDPISTAISEEFCDDKPLLQKPDIHKNNPLSDFVPLNLAPENNYDKFFVESHVIYADELAEKSKLDEEMKTRLFGKELLFAYSHPNNRYVNKKAKRYGNQVIKRAWQMVSASEGSDRENLNSGEIECTHRTFLNYLTEESLVRSYESKFRKMNHLSREESKLLINAFYHSEARSYLAKAELDAYFLHEQEAAKDARKELGAPSNYLLRANTKNYEKEVAANKFKRFRRILANSNLDKEIKAQVETLFFRPHLIEKFPLAIKHFEAAIKKMDENIFSENLNDSVRVAIFRDHLFFQKHYFSMMEQHEPPLTSEEVEQLTDHISGLKNTLPKSLQRIDEVCYRHGYEQLLSRNPHYTIHWKMNPSTMNQANIFCDIFYQELTKRKLPHKLLDHLIDSQIEIEESLKGQFAEIIELGKKEVSKYVGVDLCFLRDQTDVADFCLELEKMLGRNLSSEQMRSILDDTKLKGNTEKEIRQILNIVREKVKERRGLPEEWMVNVGYACAISDDNDLLIQFQKKLCRYLSEIKYELKTFENDHFSNQLEVNETSRIIDEMTSRSETLLLYTKAGCSKYYLEESPLNRHQKILENNKEPFGLVNQLFNYLSYNYANILVPPPLKTNELNKTIEKLVDIIDETLPDNLLENTSKVIAEYIVSMQYSLLILDDFTKLKGMLIDAIPKAIGGITYKITNNGVASHIALTITPLLLVVISIITEITTCVLNCCLGTNATVSTATDTPVIEKKEQPLIPKKIRTHDRLLKKILLEIEENESLIVDAILERSKLPESYRETIEGSIEQALSNIDELIDIDNSERYRSKYLKKRVRWLIDNWRDIVYSNIHSNHCLGGTLQLLIKKDNFSNSKSTYKHDNEIDSIPVFVEAVLEKTCKQMIKHALDVDKIASTNSLLWHQEREKADPSFHEVCSA